MSGDEAGDRGGTGLPSDAGQAPGDQGLSERLKRLEAQLDRTRRPDAAGVAARPGKADGAALGTAMRLSTEFVAGVIAGGILGWIFDRFLNTKPWGLMVFLMLGFVTGVYNVMRLTGFLGPARAKESGGSRNEG